MKNKKSAFTLIELLVVIAIIGILATIAVVALQNARAKARDARRVADVKQIQTALELFFNDQGRYPLVDEFASGALFSTSTNGTTTYMAKIPTAPTPPEGTCSSANNNYSYVSSDGYSYTLSFCLSGPTGSLKAGINTASPIGIAYGGVGAGTSNSCSCTSALLSCCDQCNPVTATCSGDTYCARSANCANGKNCINGTCVSKTIPDMLLWFMADAGVTKDGSNKVSVWSDQSANGYYAQPGNQPLFVSNAKNGKPVIRFDGTNYLLLNSSIPAASGYTFFYVVSTGAAKTGSETIFSAAQSGHIRWANSCGSDIAGWAGTDSSLVLGNPFINTNTYYSLSYTKDSAAWTIRSNGSVIRSVSDTSMPTSNVQMTIGSEAGGGYTMAGDIAEIIVYGSALSDSDRQLVESYLNTKYAIY
ncbi:MAG: prepilin-type N-terminal cleavage/methylation domain-containing protein [Candidatus Falkowbacteria bacterium]